jgi:hypothetical protein
MVPLGTHTSQYAFLVGETTDMGVGGIETAGMLMGYRETPMGRGPNILRN